MSRRRQAAETPSQLVYDGRTLLGAVTRKADAFVAIDRDGKRIGKFTNRNDAFAAILKAPRPGRTEAS